MAFTVTKEPTVFGNKRTVILKITADASTQTIETGLKNVLAFNYGPSSMNSSNIHIAANSNASGVQSMGVIGISGCTNGDLFFVTVFGN